MYKQSRLGYARIALPGRAGPVLRHLSRANVGQAYLTVTCVCMPGLWSHGMYYQAGRTVH